MHAHGYSQICSGDSQGTCVHNQPFLFPNLCLQMSDCDSFIHTVEGTAQHLWNWPLPYTRIHVKGYRSDERNQSWNNDPEGSLWEHLATRCFVRGWLWTFAASRGFITCCFRGAYCINSECAGVVTTLRCCSSHKKCSSYVDSVDHEQIICECMHWTNGTCVGRRVASSVAAMHNGLVMH